MENNINTEKIVVEYDQFDKNVTNMVLIIVLL